LREYAVRAAFRLLAFPFCFAGKPLSLQVAAFTAGRSLLVLAWKAIALGRKTSMSLSRNYDVREAKRQPAAI